MTNDDIIAALTDASKGLLFPSESDEPFTAFRWQAVADETVQQAVMRVTSKADAPETTPIAKFFSDLEGSDDAARFESLQKMFDAMLADTVVVRYGKSR